MRRTPSAEDKKQAQQYAQAVLDGTGPVKYLSWSQVPNAMINAGVPITTEKTPAKTTTVSSAGGGDGGMNVYLQALERQRAEKQAALDAQYRQGKKNIEDSAAASNKDAYTAYMHGIKNMPQKSAMYGSGGMAQSLANKSQLNYENNRNNIAVAKQQALADLESDYRAGVLDAGDDYLTKLSAVQGKIGSGGSAGGTTKTTVPAKTTYRVAGTNINADSEVSLFNQLRQMGFTQKEAEDYMVANGIVKA